MQCSAAKPWVSALMWMTLTTHANLGANRVHHFMVKALLNVRSLVMKDNALYHNSQAVQAGGTCEKAQGVCMASKSPRTLYDQAICLNKSNPQKICH